MNRNVFVSALVAISLTTGGFAYSQDGGDRTGHDRADQAQRNNDRDSRRNEARPIHRWQRQDRVRSEPWNRDHGVAGQRGDRRGAGPDHALRRGDRLPPEYRYRSYVVDDWRGHHLTAPPNGYHWVQVGADYVLVAIATGIILQLLLND